LTVKKLFTTDHLIAILFMTQYEREIKLRTELRAQTIKELLDAKYGIKRNRAYISRCLRKLKREGILKKVVHTHQRPGEAYVGQSSFYQLADFEKAFNDIRADRQELHRLKDTLRHQKHRRRKKAQNNIVSQIEQKLLKDCGTKTTTGGEI